MPFSPYSNMFGFGGIGMAPAWSLVILVVAAWSLVWKGMALWRAARRGETYWFIALLVVNTLGILEILYLYVFTKPDQPSVPKSPNPTVG